MKNCLAGENKMKALNDINVQVYFVFALGLFFQFVPNEVLGLTGLFLLLAVMIATYIIRSRAQANDLNHNHMTYIIRTFWIGSLYLSVGILIASVLIYPKIDLTPLYNILEGRSAVTDPDTLMAELFRINKDLLLYIGLPLVAPGIVFFIYRCVYGVSRAAKGHRVAKVNSWL